MSKLLKGGTIGDSIGDYCILPYLPRGSIYTTIRELCPKIPCSRRNYGSQFLNGCICGPSGLANRRTLSFLGFLFGSL